MLVNSSFNSAPQLSLFKNPFQGGGEQQHNAGFSPLISGLLLQSLLGLVMQLVQQLEGNKPKPDPQPQPQPGNNPWDTDRGDIMLFGDPAENRIVPMKLSTFERLPDIDIDAQKVYSADHVTDDKAYVMNRGSNFITILERDPATKEFKETGDIDLPFWPRTGSKNTKLGLELVTGIDKPMWGLIDFTKDELVAAGGRNVVTQGSIGNFDGENATGHGTWVSDDQFVVPDRENETLYLYKASKKNGSWEVIEQDKVKLPSSTHTLHGGPDEGVLFASLEGSAKDGVAAGLAELTLQGDNLALKRIVAMPESEQEQGTHHPAFHPDNQHIYVGDNSGFVHVVNKDSMEITHSIPAGKGAGHVAFIPEKNLAVVTNHGDTFITVIDMQKHQFIANIEVAKDVPEYDEALQAHTARVSPDGKYYYNFASDSGTFFRVNLDTLQKDGEIYTGGTPKQASQPGELTLGYNGEVGAAIGHGHD